MRQSLEPSNGVLTLAFNNAQKLNAWTLPLLQEFLSALDEASKDGNVKGVVVTGAPAKYYSAGVDLSALIKVMWPSKLVYNIRKQNQTVFQKVIDFPKPIVAAVNGPAIGAAVTSATLMDAIVAAEEATFSLPFAKLGVPPEGCSSILFPEKMGAQLAQRMLGTENWIPKAREAKEAGLIDLVCKQEELLEHATRVCVEQIEKTGRRRFDAEESARRRRVNAEESAALANAFVSPHFLSAMQAFNLGRGKKDLARFFRIALITQPIWKPKPIEPDYNFKVY